MSVGRNDPCPCGSGRKYKKCCLKKDRARERESRDVEFVAQETERTIADVVELADVYLDRDPEPLYELCEVAGLDAYVVEHDGFPLFLAATFGRPRTPGAKVMHAALSQRLTDRQRELWREVGSAPYDLFRFEQARGGMRFTPRSGSAPLTLRRVPPTLKRERDGFVVGYVIQTLDLFIGSTVCGHAVTCYDTAAEGDRALVALRVAADPHEEFKRGVAGRLAHPNIMVQLRRNLKQLMLFPGQVALPDGEVWTLYRVMMDAPPSMLRQVVDDLVERAYSRLTTALWQFEGPRAEKRAALERLLPRAAVLELVPLTPEGDLPGWDPAAYLRQPAGLLLLPPDHPVWADHDPGQPIRLLRSWRGPRAEEVEEAIETWLLERRFCLAAALLPADRRGHDEVLSFLTGFAHPDLLEAPLEALDLDRGTKGRTTRALKALHQREGAAWKLLDLRGSSAMLSVRGFGEGSLGKLAEALVEWAGVWRARAANLAPEAVARVALQADVDEDLREGLAELASVFD